MKTNSAKKTFGKFLLFLAVIVVLLGIGQFFHFDRERIQEGLSRFSLAASGIVYVIVYVVSSSLIWVGPKDILRLAAVFVYGPYVSTVFVTIAEMINLVVMFSLARKLGRPFVAQRLRGGMQQIDTAIAETAYGLIFFLRLILFIPLRFLDLGFGLTKIALWKYFLISLLATPLRIFFVQFFWSLGIETVTNPGRLSAYLMAHPQIMAGTFVYFFGSLAMVLILKWRANRRR